MYMVRPTKTEIDAWAALVPGGSDKWNWDSLFKGMQDSETFTAPTDDVKKAGNIQFNAVSHGTSGPIHVTYPGLYVPLLSPCLINLFLIFDVQHATNRRRLDRLPRQPRYPHQRRRLRWRRLWRFRSHIRHKPNQLDSLLRPISIHRPPPTPFQPRHPNKRYRHPSHLLQLD